MNLVQKIFIWIGLALSAGMAIYPPWIQTFKPSVPVGEDVELKIEPTADQYDWIFRPPGPPQWFRKAKDFDVLKFRDGVRNGTFRGGAWS